MRRETQVGCLPEHFAQPLNVIVGQLRDLSLAGMSGDEVLHHLPRSSTSLRRDTHNPAPRIYGVESGVKGRPTASTFTPVATLFIQLDPSALMAQTNT